jgi:hypothetical protein
VSENACEEKKIIIINDDKKTEGSDKMPENGTHT